MRKLLATLSLCLFLGGCATATLLTKSVTNPVTTQDLYQVEASINIAVVGLNTYKQACVQKAVDTNCRANVAAIQRYTTQLPPYLTQLRVFVKQNDQLNAINTYNTLTALYNQAKSTAQNLGVNLGS